MVEPIDYDDNDATLTLASEECPPDLFSKIHKFGNYEQKIIRKLIAHGPVLVRGGRGSGKSALLIEAYNRLRSNAQGNALGVYVSLRYLPLLRSEGLQYENNFCFWLSKAIDREIRGLGVGMYFPMSQGISDLQNNLNDLAEKIGKRIVLLFDDAAHIGRETPLTEFFDIFRVLSTDIVSCKASIYPGVTKFGTRFDVFNDATVIDIIRDERSPDFADFFLEVISARYPSLAEDAKYSERISAKFFTNFIGRAVLGNMRALVVACEWFSSRESIGFPDITTGFLHMSSNYYWPLLDEVAPKLGVYEKMVDPAQKICERLFETAAHRSTSAIITHKDIVSRYSKPFEILEYVGFVSRREASRALKSGGRGAVFSINLCTLLERTPKSRVSREVAMDWLDPAKEPAEIHISSNILSDISLPDVNGADTLSIFEKPIEVIAKSGAYPYGLTPGKIECLRAGGYSTVGELAEARDEDLLHVDGIGGRTVEKIRSVVYQAIWM